MKYLSLFCLITFLLFSFKSDEEIQEYLGVSKTLNFDGKSFDLKWSSKNGNYYIQEYLDKNESLNNYSEMISLFVLNESISVKDALAIKELELKEFKKTDPACNYAITYGPKSKGYMIDFLRSEYIADVTTKVEFNAYRYVQIKIGKNKKAVLVYAFSKRVSGKEITPFLKSLKEGRFVYIEKLFSVDLPKINLTEFGE